MAFSAQPPEYAARRILGGLGKNGQDERRVLNLLDAVAARQQLQELADLGG